MLPIDYIRKLAAADQFSLAERIWDGLLEFGSLVLQWQIEEVRKRAAELDSNPAIALTSEQVWAEVDQRRNG